MRNLQVGWLRTSVPAIDGSIPSGRGVAFVRPESVTVTADADGNATVASIDPDHRRLDAVTAMVEMGRYRYRR